jgi:serine protease inhibitor
MRCFAAHRSHHRYQGLTQSMQPERATGRLMRMKNECAAQAGPPPVVFDRPHLMVMNDRTTGEPLFMARVTDPTQP